MLDRASLLSVALLSGACTSPPRALPACLATDAGPGVGTAELQGADPVILAAGDIAECGSSGAETTARLLDRMEGTVVALGDNVYESGALDDYLDCYGPTWGRHRARTRPAVGNHDYGTPRAGAYFAYFCGAAGEPFKGWYSYERGRWHVVVLNSNCTEVACGPGSEQEQWLRDDLRAHPTSCTLAYWHHPRFSSGEHGDAGEMDTLWRVLDEFGVDVALTGHDHNYERFAPLSPLGELDATRGIREFVVGTGGRKGRAISGVRRHSDVRLGGELGVLALTLHDDSYEWRFVRGDGSTGDSGSDRCH